MSNEIKVSISDYKVSESPDKLITLGLGSCVGVAIYDKITKIGGLSHIMLPDSFPTPSTDYQPHNLLQGQSLPYGRVPSFFQENSQ